MQPEFHPLRFKPIYKQYVWGGRRLETELGRRLEHDGVYAESWEVADHNPDESVVQSGPLAGTTLHQLVSRRGLELLGRHHPQPRFPLLLKFLDANQPLSVQVHPDDQTASRMGLADLGKTEAWFVLQAEPGSVIWAGFDRPVDRATLKRAIEEGRLEEVLHRFEPSAGQCVYLPAGTVHALGRGLLVAEIQQTSDNTFRLYDWSRLGQDGQPRPLHVESGLEATDYGAGAVGPQQTQQTTEPHVQRLVQCDKFVLDRWSLTGTRSAGGDQRCHILTVLQGVVRVQGATSDQPLGKGRTVVLPASLGPVDLTADRDEPAMLLDAYLP